MRNVAEPGLRLGMLPKPNDMRLLNGPPKHELTGAALTEMDDWSKIHALDPRLTLTLTLTLTPDLTLTLTLTLTPDL